MIDTFDICMVVPARSQCADLKRLRSVHDLVLFGREFHNLAPHVVSDWSPYLVVFEWDMHNVLAFS